MGERPADRPIALTIGTAGPVDHGKTTRGRQLPGTDTEGLKEAHRLGIRIVRGYGELDLPRAHRARLGERRGTGAFSHT